jgi:serine/threonine-protein kinase
LGLWPFSKKKKPAAPADPDAGRGAPGPQSRPLEPGPAAKPRLPPDALRLVAIGTSSGPSIAEALATLRALRDSPDEGPALDELVRRNATAPLPDPIALAVAQALVARGEPREALTVLDGATASDALVFRADLLADKGDVGHALALAERVLLRDFDRPGVRERHRRWRQLLGFEADVKRPDAAAATVASRDPDAPFSLVREVARGGAGAVYEATDRELGRRVALKVYHRPERDRAQLSHEARVAVDLGGPGVVRVFDVDAEHGWIALEWAALGALRDFVKTKDLGVLLPVGRWADPIASALARVHARGWVHHDVKPANVILRAPDDPVLTDFGIARRAGEPSPPGSFGYVSPERLAGRPSDPRDDVYGFGRLLDDALDAVGTRADTTAWRRLAAACAGPDAARPTDGRALLTRLRVEAPR